MKTDRTHRRRGSSDAVLDPAMLGALLDEADEEGLGVLRRVVASYCSGKLQDEIERSAATADWEVLERAAHNLKSLSATLGARQVAEIAGELEEAAVAHDQASCRRLLPRTASRLELACKALEETPVFDAELVVEMRRGLDRSQ